MQDMEAAKLQKEVDEELNLGRSFKGNHSSSCMNDPSY
jgi:hypothetical protein